jgi:hypothetical protein
MKFFFDVILITICMAVGFVVIIMNLTGMWPCNILYTVDKYPFTNNSSLTQQDSNNFIDYTRYWLINLFRCN